MTNLCFLAFGAGTLLRFLGISVLVIAVLACIIGWIKDKLGF